MELLESQTLSVCMHQIHNRRVCGFRAACDHVSTTKVSSKFRVKSIVKTSIPLVNCCLVDYLG